MSDRGHHESDWEVAERSRGMSRNPRDAKVAVTVSIPVKVGGYTGQRDAWEETTGQFCVVPDGDSVELHRLGSVYGYVSKITIPRDGLEAALKLLGTLGG